MTGTLADLADALSSLMGSMPWLERALELGMLVIVVVMAVVVVRRTDSARRLRAFGTRYGCADLLGGFTASAGERTCPGAFRLVAPRWEHAKQDGTADLRMGDNHVIREPSTLDLDGFHLAVDDPRAMYALVRRLRAVGAQVAPCEEERAAAERSGAVVGSAVTAASVDDIVARFSDRPQDFEGYCAWLLRVRGYSAEVTPPSRDGGYDVIAERDGTRVIVECKCFSGTTVVGRPLLQKLVGANAEVRAERLLFMTTSRYSAEALAYSREVGMDLVDGDALVAMARASEDDVDASVWDMPGSCLLADDDLDALYPADLRRRPRARS
ncbi:MAG: restriction endonuclease [Atopobiaceae bacterium]|jgi:restriction system protein|nr:restriction endonuclease [Atopobiaceae bacterium]MCI2172777.1 restriction endonuclease [Atopobiaceae bacterium]MCI2207084.1 restriction endonuclease [Atopobiaceae bacterium]